MLIGWKSYESNALFSFPFFRNTPRRALTNISPAKKWTSIRWNSIFGTRRVSSCSHTISRKFFFFRGKTFHIQKNYGFTASGNGKVGNIPLFPWYNLEDWGKVFFVFSPISYPCNRHPQHSIKKSTFLPCPFSRFPTCFFSLFLSGSPCHFHLFTRP